MNNIRHISLHQLPVTGYPCGAAGMWLSNVFTNDSIRKSEPLGSMKRLK